MNKNYIAFNPENQEVLERILSEYNELDERIQKLQSFMCTPKYRSLSYNRRELLSRQFQYMVTYECILDCRINDFIMNS